MTRTKKVLISILVIMMLLVLSLGGYILYYKYGRFNHGIPCGGYEPLDENGDKIETVMEYCLFIGEDDVEYSYMKYEIVKDNGKLYIKECSEYNSDRQYEISYDKETKILTVYFPDNIMDSGREEDGKLIPHYFKR